MTLPEADTSVGSAGMNVFGAEIGMSQMVNLTNLVTQAQHGDRYAYGVLYEHFQPRVYATALRRLRDAPTAQDLTQDVLLHAFVKLRQLRQPAAFPGWLHQMTVRRVLNHTRRTRADTLGGEELLRGQASAMSSPLEALLSREQTACVQQGLARLNAMDRATLQAFYVEGKSLATISREGGTPVGTIKRRLHVARKRLQRELEYVLGSDGRVPGRADGTASAASGTFSA
jgi:RNA polymerase sigma-70 factor (ECF subfamily)